MNTYQSPYIDGQVLGSDGDEAVRNGGADAPLPIAQPESKISGCTKSASDCLHKTTKLAREFNHGTVSAAHLILAMTLIPNASRQFELRKVDIDKAFRAAMHALMEIERGSPSNGAFPSLSEEFNVVVTLAQELARNRDNQEVSVDDLLTALDRLPADSSAAQLIRGERRNAAGADLQQALEQLAAGVNQQFQHFQDIRNLQFQETRRLIESLRSDMAAGDLARLKSYHEMRDGEIERLIRSGFAEVAARLTPPSAERPDIATALDTASPSMPHPDASEDTLWDKIFGRKPPVAPPMPGSF